MRRETLTKAMRAAISNVLESMFFLPVQFADSKCTLKEWFSDEQLLFGAGLSFDGSLSGSLWLAVPVSVVNEITASFLGLGKYEINDEQRRDTIKEALNMIGGHGFFLFDKKGTFTLGIPRSIEGQKLVGNTSGDSNENIILIETKQNHLAVGVIVERNGEMEEIEWKRR
jgi:CheY-specific phosphatase CheX